MQRMMQKIAVIVAGILLVSSVAIMATTQVSALGLSDGMKAAQGDGMAKSVDANGLNDTVGGAVNLILWVVGILSVVMIVYGGARYILSGGDSGKLTAAKNTIIYSVVGLIITIFAYAIVNFVATQSTNGFSGGKPSAKP